uniref:Uncharacterized protein n=1 Tax=Rhizophora mucronata TaxID=61149 RepID=A0A2P2R0P7_RHIMU
MAMGDELPSDMMMKMQFESLLQCVFVNLG